MCIFLQYVKIYIFNVFHHFEKYLQNITYYKQFISKFIQVPNWKECNILLLMLDLLLDVCLSVIEVSAI